MVSNFLTWSKRNYYMHPCCCLHLPHVYIRLLGASLNRQSPYFVFWSTWIDTSTRFIFISACGLLKWALLNCASLAHEFLLTYVTASRKTLINTIFTIPKMGISLTLNHYAYRARTANSASSFLMGSQSDMISTAAVPSRCICQT
jgi:hypothetical protein